MIHFVQAALYISTAKLLAKAAIVIAASPEPAKLFQHFTMHFGIRTNGEAGITRGQQIRALDQSLEHPTFIEHRTDDLRKADISCFSGRKRATWSLSSDGGFDTDTIFRKSRPVSEFPRPQSAGAAHPGRLPPAPSGARSQSRPIRVPAMKICWNAYE